MPDIATSPVKFGATDWGYDLRGSSLTVIPVYLGLAPRRYRRCSRITLFMRSTGPKGVSETGGCSGALGCLVVAEVTRDCTA